MLIPNLIVNGLQVAHWPAMLRRPMVLPLIRRKSLTSELRFQTKLHGYVYSGDARNMIDYHILSRGVFEPGLTELLRLWGRSHAGTVFLDVGANVGVHTLGTASAFQQVIAVEPFPPLAEKLLRTVNDNRIKNITIHQCALANEQGKAMFHAPRISNLGTGKIVSNQQDPAEVDIIEVEIRKGDQMLSEITHPVSAIKIDTEGAEIKVLSGLTSTLAENRPLVTIEILEDDATSAEALKAMFPNDYRFLTIGNIKRKAFTLQDWSCGAGDIAAIPSEKVHLLDQWIS